MSDVFVFVFGCLVTLMVGGAVSLLVWGAANEPSIREVPDDDPAAHPLPHRVAPASATGDR